MRKLLQRRRNYNFYLHPLSPSEQWVLRNSLCEKSDYRDLLLERNNTLIINLNVLPALILQSAEKNLVPMIQSRVNKQKGKIKNHYDKTSRKSLQTYKRSSKKLVVRSSKDKIWYKATILKKTEEPRSYWPIMNLRMYYPYLTRLLLTWNTVQ
ncbi:hypothetical protein JTB14_011721 [Gonioctena quinquepunctata]|nr:hypothetical protein JTB14_011721 [Gonioctena quinquepunctata]